MERLLHAQQAILHCKQNYPVKNLMTSDNDAVAHVGISYWKSATVMTMTIMVLNQQVRVKSKQKETFTMWW